MDYTRRPEHGDVKPVVRPEPSRGAAELAERLKKGKKGANHGRPERGVKVSIEGRNM